MNINLACGPDKLEELVLHISEMSEKDARFASTKLNKLVWSSDFKAFCETGRTITGATYQKGDFGPIPRAMPIILERLKTEGRLDLKRVKIGNKMGVRPVAKKSANLTAFSQCDLGVVDKVIAENFGKTGTAMSTDTHKHLAHTVAEKGETIPFAAWLISARKPTDKEREHGRALDAKHAQKA